MCVMSPRLSPGNSAREACISHTKCTGIRSRYHYSTLCAWSKRKPCSAFVHAYDQSSLTNVWGTGTVFQLVKSIIGRVAMVRYPWMCVISPHLPPGGSPRRACCRHTVCTAMGSRYHYLTLGAWSLLTYPAVAHERHVVDTRPAQLLDHVITT